MVLSPHINTRENNKFCESDGGETAVRTCYGGSEPGAGAMPVEGAELTPNIINTLIPTAGVEVSQALTDGVTYLMVKVREDANLQYAWGVGESATKFVTVPACAVLTLEGKLIQGRILYMRTDTAGVTVEIQELHT